MKLEKFREKDHKKRITIGISIVLVLLVAGIIVYRSFAFYEEKKAFDVIKGQVPDQNYDLMFSFYVEDENGEVKQLETIPEEKDYIVTIECNKDAIGEWDKESWGPRITNLTSARTKCKIYFKRGIEESKKVVEYPYSGNVQEYIAPVDGIYKLEVWGAAGGYTYGSYGQGGYSSGYIILDKGTVLYICCGGYNPVGGGTYHAGGYNGGGDGRGTNVMHVTGGGGATHIAMKSGTLKSLGYDYAVSIVKSGENGTQLKGVLIVAGGGGATGKAAGSHYGGSGGGTSGGWGSTYGGVGNRPSGLPGTQTAAGANGHGLYTDTNGDAYAGGFGYGGSAKSTVTTNVVGGGGGWFGGGVGHAPSSNPYGDMYGGGGGGGSGYIGGVPSFTVNETTYSPATSVGGNSGAGKAKITFIDYYKK